MERSDNRGYTQECQAAEVRKQDVLSDFQRLYPVEKGAGKQKLKCGALLCAEEDIPSNM